MRYRPPPLRPDILEMKRDWHDVIKSYSDRLDNDKQISTTLMNRLVEAEMEIKHHFGLVMNDFRIMDNRLQQYAHRWSRSTWLGKMLLNWKGEAVYRHEAKKFPEYRAVLCAMEKITALYERINADAF